MDIVTLININDTLIGKDNKQAYRSKDIRFSNNVNELLLCIKVKLKTFNLLFFVFQRFNIWTDKNDRSDFNSTNNKYIKTEVHYTNKTFYYFLMY